MCYYQNRTSEQRASHTPTSTFCQSFCTDCPFSFMSTLFKWCCLFWNCFCGCRVEWIYVALYIYIDIPTLRMRSVWCYHRTSLFVTRHFLDAARQHFRIYSALQTPTQRTIIVIFEWRKKIMECNGKWVVSEVNTLFAGCLCRLWDDPMSRCFSREQLMSRRGEWNLFWPLIAQDNIIYWQRAHEEFSNRSFEHSSPQLFVYFLTFVVWMFICSFTSLPRTLAHSQVVIVQRLQKVSRAAKERNFCSRYSRYPVPVRLV